MKFQISAHFKKKTCHVTPHYPQIFDSKIPTISLDIICEWSVVGQKDTRSYKSRLSFRIMNGDIIDKVPSMTHSTIVGAAVPLTAPEYQRKIQATKAAMTFGTNRRLRWNRKINLFHHRIHIWYIYLYPHENHKHQHGFLIKRKHLSQMFPYISYV